MRLFGRRLVPMPATQRAVAGNTWPLSIEAFDQLERVNLALIQVERDKASRARRGEVRREVRRKVSRPAMRKAML